MQVATARRLYRVIRAPSILLYSDYRFQAPVIESTHSSLQCGNYSTFGFSGIGHDSCEPSTSKDARSLLHNGLWWTKKTMPKALYSTGASAVEGTPTEAVKEFYDKMLKSVAKQRTSPPNAWLWSLIKKCANNDDISLLFELSNLRIHADFNSHLCTEITKACARVGAIDFGKKALWKHNLYGLSPSIGSAQQLLLYAKQHNDAELLEEVMKLLKRNDLPLQSGTADIVLSICYNIENWELMSKYAKRFIRAGVKLRQTSFDVWMEFAAKRGDFDSLWKAEKLRSEHVKQHTLVSGFSCAKGFILERKPESAAATVLVLNQTLSDAKRPGVMVELQKLVSEWPFEVVKHHKEEDRKALAAALQTDIPAMVNGLLNLGLDVNVNMEDLTAKPASAESNRANSVPRGTTSPKALISG